MLAVNSAHGTRAYNGTGKVGEVQPESGGLHKAKWLEVIPNCQAVGHVTRYSLVSGNADGLRAGVMDGTVGKEAFILIRQTKVGHNPWRHNGLRALGMQHDVLVRIDADFSHLG